MSLDPREKYAKEVYNLIDKNYKKLPRNSRGEFDETQSGFVNNDIDALRHAYVSGIFTQKYGASVANLLGILNEITPFQGRSDPGWHKDENMDLWNNAVGRKYGKETKTEKELFDKLMKALKNGELIIDPNDTREYDGDKFTELDRKNRIIVLEESKTGKICCFLIMIQNNYAV